MGLAELKYTKVPGVNFKLGDKHFKGYKLHALGWEKYFGNTSNQINKLDNFLQKSSYQQ